MVRPPPTSKPPQSKGTSQKPLKNSKSSVAAAKPKGVTKAVNKSKKLASSKVSTQSLRDNLSKELVSLGTSKISGTKDATSKALRANVESEEIRKSSDFASQSASSIVKTTASENVTVTKNIEDLKKLGLNPNTSIEKTPIYTSSTSEEPKTTISGPTANQVNLGIVAPTARGSDRKKLKLIFSKKSAPYIAAGTHESNKIYTTHIAAATIPQPTTTENEVRNYPLASITAPTQIMSSEIHASTHATTNNILAKLPYVNNNPTPFTTPQTFPKFPLLPSLLRRTIWFLASLSPEPRTVTITSIPQDQKYRIHLPFNHSQHLLPSLNLLKTTSRTPSLMATTHESRKIASYIYCRIAGERWGQTNIWFHFGVDTLHVKGFHPWNIIFGGNKVDGMFLSPETEGLVKRVRFLRVGIPFEEDWELGLERGLLKAFPQLRVLELQFRGVESGSSGTGVARLGVRDLGWLVERRGLEDGFIRWTEESQIIGKDYRDGWMGLPVVHWRTGSTLHQISEREKNGLFLQPTENSKKEQPEPLRFTKAHWATLHGW